MNIRPYVISFAALNAVTTFAAVPLRWTVETSRVQPAVFDAYQGETLTFEAALQSKGKPLEAPLNYSFFWQTNGMGSTYWEAPCPVPSSSLDGASTNVLFATFTPSMDVGARVYNCFIGSPSNIYHAAFQLRLRPSPGATPNALPLPTPVIDFAKVRVLNPPWGSGGGGGCDTNAVERIANAAVETNAVTVCLRASVSSLESSKLSKSDVVAPSGDSRDGQAAEAKVVRAELDSIINMASEAARDAGTALYKIGETKAALDNIKITAEDALWAAERLETNKADRSMISATDPTFSNEVATVARTVTPPPSPTLRIFDNVRQCYWIGRMVNGVINWEVEE